MENKIFEACQSGDMSGAKMLRDGGTCLHLAVLAGNSDSLKKILLPQFINERNKQGDTALHLAVRKYRIDLVKPLLDAKPNLSLENNREETPVCIAVKFGFLDIIEEFIEHERNAVRTLCQDKNLLHRAVERNRVQIVEFFVNKKDGVLKESINQPFRVSPTKTSDNEPLINQPVEVSSTKSSNNEFVEFPRTKPFDNEGKIDKKTVNNQPIVEGDTPLHIAARNKNEPIVDMLLKVHGVNRHALNSEGKTPLDVAREVTEYHESFRLIKKLTDYPPNLKPFMYCAPEVSQEKHKRAMVAVDKSFGERRNAELVVAALLATMTFTAVFTVPGGSYQDSDEKNKGTPVFLGYYMFKLFIIFDCIAFFLSLFVCIMWQLASELTTEDKMLFMSVSGLLTCLSFGYTACGFMAAVHTIIAHKDEILAWVILGNLLLIAFCGVIAFIHQSAIFLVARARFHRLCGVPRRLDNTVEAVWQRAEHCGFLNIIRCLDDTSHDAVEGDKQKHLDKTSHDALEGHEQDHGYNCSCSSSPCLRNIPQSV